MIRGRRSLERQQRRAVLLHVRDLLTSSPADWCADTALWEATHSIFGAMHHRQIAEIRREFCAAAGIRPLGSAEAIWRWFDNRPNAHRATVSIIDNMLGRAGPVKARAGLSRLRRSARRV